MISASTIYKLERYRTFVGQVYKLCSSGIYSKPLNAAHDLLSELLEHRLRHMTNRQIEEAIAEDNEVFSYKIIYAEKDLVRKHYRDIAKEKRMAELVANGMPANDSSLPVDLGTNTRTTDDIQEAISLLPYIFSNRQTQEWVAYVLNYGQQETMAHFGQSPRAFRQKLLRSCKLAEQRQLTTVGLLENQEDKAMLSELETLTSFAQLLADEATTATDIQRWIASHKQYVEDIIGLTPGIKYQATLVNHFAKASLPDQYAFVNACQSRLDSLQHKLVTR